MSALSEYAKSVVTKAGRSFVSCEVFAKVLTRNDDSGRHGVLIPTDAYSFFPLFLIRDPSENETKEFSGFNSILDTHATVAYKYYERYPERRITRLPGLLNEPRDSRRILIFLRAKHADGTSAYYFDAANSAPGGRFDNLFHLIFGTEIPPAAGVFIVRAVDSGAFSADGALLELLEKFDRIKNRGWIDTLRAGDTGIGYTFETLAGIKENNDQKADYKGIEIKCKGIKEDGGSKSSKINLFQEGPVWTVNANAKELIRILGKPRENGLYACHSQVTPLANNLGLLLSIWDNDKKIDLRKNTNKLGFWSYSQLETRLLEKHSRAAFIKAKTKTSKTKTQFFYEELVYCDKPTISKFMHLVEDRKIVFEFLMSENPDGTIRNRGYPWRLTRDEFLEQLFGLKIKLR